MGDELGFDYEQIFGEIVKGIYGSGILVYNQGGVAFEKIKIQLTNSKLLFHVDYDYDEIICGIFENLEDDEGMLPIAQLGHYIGAELGWIWSAKNFLGYRDMITISFDNMDPNFSMLAAARRLQLLSVSAIK